ncbi:uncharacterized protein BDZ99DRAFT_502029 [Mytilinidion resinicola]|uniref:Uncharacterized protein n=1 Tax=Mytilinidion resinicola TaxID=574789 RepID=A0A6A6YAX7_9PEZI|nr:uncharacterized protein BDZ99DRAFT_502029 [Mytilinidion resinicola]KAF2805164.1 hypothetical protein BDZ99DRAFT_502029 [Mytilinidion resinicola]
MSTEKRPFAYDAADRAATRKKSRASAPRPPNALSAFNAAESPFLRLPAELRNSIYELVFTVNPIHVEHERKDDPDVRRSYRDPVLAQVTDVPKYFRFYLCQADISEAEAYRRSIDTTLDERIALDDEEATQDLHPNHWRMGDRFHIDSCKERHKACIPPPLPPAWLSAQTQLTEPPNKPISLKHTLTLSLLRVCAQIHTEAHALPYTLSHFSFRHAAAFRAFLSALPPRHGPHLREFTLCMTAGENPTDAARCARWNTHLFESGARVARLRGLRTLHLSLTIAHHEMGADGPLRADLAAPAQLDMWVVGLGRLRELALQEVTVVVTDDPGSRFGIDGAQTVRKYMLGHFHGSWGAMRERECFTAGEKRWWAERMRGRLLWGRKGDEGYYTSAGHHRTSPQYNSSSNSRLSR